MKKSTLKREEAERDALRKESAEAWAELQEAQSALWEKWKEGRAAREAKLAKLLTEVDNEEAV